MRCVSWDLLPHGNELSSESGYPPKQSSEVNPTRVYPFVNSEPKQFCSLAALIVCSPEQKSMKSKFKTCGIPA
jgi:hypothetical protein